MWPNDHSHRRLVLRSLFGGSLIRRQLYSSRVFLNKLVLKKLGFSKLGLEKLGLEKLGLEKLGLEKLGLEKAGFAQDGSFIPQSHMASMKFSEIDVLEHPETLGRVRESLHILKAQIKVAEALEHAKDRLTKARPLDSNTLSKCNVFIHYVNQAEVQSNFSLEVSKLSLNELVFSSISFEERRLKTLLDSFRASDVEKYVRRQNLSCIDRSEIFTRFGNILAGCKGSRFDEIYKALVQSKGDPLESERYIHVGMCSARFGAGLQANLNRCYPRNIARIF